MSLSGSHWHKLTLRLNRDIAIVKDCADRLSDGVENLNELSDDLGYVRAQLAQLEERCRIMRDRLTDFHRAYLSPNSPHDSTEE